MSIPSSFTFPSSSTIREAITFDNARWNYTDFQQKFVNEVSKRPDFDHFVTFDYTFVQPTIRKPQWCNILWFENDQLHGIRVGCKRVLGTEVKAAELQPASL